MDGSPASFDPAFDLSRLSRERLARLGREYMLFGHLLDRGLMPHVGRRFGPQVMEEIAIQEWMGASPVYNARVRRAFAMAGRGVDAIFKSLQLDPGFPHQYMDVGYELESEARGFFWLNQCGALQDVEPHGEKAVLSTCHAMEDPTFDATASAVHPQARCRPVHRPPRVPADRVPVCRWQVSIDPSAPPIPEAPITRSVRASRLAGIALERPADAEPGGLPDYAGPFRPSFTLEDLSQGALVLACREMLVADHLLIRASMSALAERFGRAEAEEAASAQWRGVAPVSTQRLRRALGIEGDDMTAILRVLQLHPAFPPGYARVGLEWRGPRRGRLWIEDCDALGEEDGLGWLPLLGDAGHPGLDAILQAVNPRARCRPAEAPPPARARCTYEIVIDDAAEPAPEPPESRIVRLTTASRFAFADRPGKGGSS